MLSSCPGVYKQVISGQVKCLTVALRQAYEALIVTLSERERVSKMLFWAQSLTIFKFF